MKIMPLGELNSKHIFKDDALQLFDNSDETKIDDIIDRGYTFTQNGKEAIRQVIEKLNLQRDDEVYITTTTESSYVVTCVSATIFNYTKLSRVLTDKTKLIYLIHTYGFANKKLLELRDEANKRGIPLFEDCAFSFHSQAMDNTMLGSIGDFTLYSLPKIFPIEYGGILSYNNKYKFDYTCDDYLKKELFKWIPKLRSMKQKKQSNYKYLYKNIDKESIYCDINNTDPFMYGFIDENYDKIDSNYDNIYRTFSNEMEFGRTHVKNEVHIPTNPFIDNEQYNLLIERINNYGKND